MKVFKSSKGKTLVLQSYNVLLKRWNVPIVEEDIQTTYGLTHIIKVGDNQKKALLLFHGVGDNSALMWIFNCKALAEYFYVIAIDTIGGPNKSVPNEYYNKQFSQVKWVDEVVTALGVLKPHMAGVSNGSAIVQNYSAHYPEKVDKVVSMAGMLFSPGKSPLKKMAKVFLPEALFPSKKNIKKLIIKLTGEHREVMLNDQDIMTQWLYLLKYFNNMSMAYHNPKPLENEQLEAIKSKLLLIIGIEDAIAYEKDNVEKVKSKGYQVIVVEDAGHGINHERSELINQLLIDYLT